MERLFTNKYNEITEINSLKIHLEGRWVCCVFRESMGKRGETITLIDNYGERYILTIDKIKDEFNIDKGAVYQSGIYLHPVLNIYSRLPDFAIDVLQTISNPVGLETLTRVADTIKRKYFRS